MKPTQTGIATALALVVVALFFIFPGLSPFDVWGSQTTQTQSAAAGDATQQSDQAQPTNITTTTMPTEPITQLGVTDEVVGTGIAAAAGDTITVQYVGALTNGTVFDASMNHGTTGFSFKLGAGQVIPGWDQGLVGMKEGGKRKLVIPAALAYGNQAVGNIIPANSPLIFEVEMVKVQKAK